MRIEEGWARCGGRGSEQRKVEKWSEGIVHTFWFSSSASRPIAPVGRARGGGTIHTRQHNPTAMSSPTSSPLREAAAAASPHRDSSSAATPADATPSAPPPPLLSSSAAGGGGSGRREPWTYTALPPDRVRWHYLTSAFAKAAVTDAPKAGGVKRFGGADSAALEAAFQAEQGRLERAWWAEAADLSAGPSAAAGAARAASARAAADAAVPVEGGWGGVGSEPTTLSSHALHPTSLPGSASASWADLVGAEAAAAATAALAAGADDAAQAPSSHTNPPPGTPVRGGAWEVDLAARSMRPCYHPAPPIRVRRGTWFLEAGGGGPAWTPLAEAVADEVEEAYRRGPWRGSSPPEAPGVRVRLATAAGDLRGAAVLLAGPDEAYLLRGGVAAWAARALPGGGGGGGSHYATPSSAASAPGLRLRRGYAPPAHPSADPAIDAAAEADADAAAACPVAAVVFAVHGVGQNLAACNIADDAAALARALAVAAAGETEAAAAAVAAVAAAAGAAGAASPARALPPPPPPPPGRVLVIPVQWRKHLALDVDATAARLQPPSVRSLRGAAHATAVEVLLYLMPGIAADMTHSLVAALNAQWGRFKARHPGWGEEEGGGGGGRASILAHSLGSVLAYDILCAQQQDKQTAGGGKVDKSTAAAAGAGAGESRTPSAPSSPVSGLLPADLTDLSPVMAPREGATPAGEAATTPAAEVRRLRAEVGALRAALAAARGGGGGGGPATAAPALSGLGLAFEVDQLICVGSPLGLFLALRRVNPDAGRGLGTAAAAGLMPWVKSPVPSSAAGSGGAGVADGLPACARLYNVFHPSDLVAHRLEPLVLPALDPSSPDGGVPRPVFAPRAGGSRLHVGLREAAEDVGGLLHAGASRAVGVVGASLRAVLRLKGAVTVRRVPPGGGGAIPGGGGGKGGGALTPTREEAAADEEAAAAAAWATARAAGSGSATPPPTAIWRLTGGPPPGPASTASSASSPASSTTTAGRLDFVLQTGPADNAYLAALGAHFMYWGSPDVALLTLRAVCGRDVRTGVPLECGRRKRAGGGRV